MRHCLEILYCPDIAWGPVDHDSIVSIRGIEHDAVLFAYGSPSLADKFLHRLLELCGITFHLHGVFLSSVDDLRFFIPLAF